MRNKKVDFFGTMPGATVLGFVISLTGVIGCLLLLSLAVNNEYIMLSNTTLYSYLIMFLCALVGVIVAGKSARENKAPVCLITGGVILVLQLCASLLLIDEIGSDVLLRVVILVAAVLCGTYLSNRKIIKRNPRRRK